MTSTDKWMISLTALIAVAGGVSAVIFEKQLTVMQGQLEVMEADQRPWVGLDKLEPSTAPNGQGFGFAAIVKNGGKTPAIKVHGTFRAEFINTGDIDSRIPKNCGNRCSVGMIMPGSTLEWPMTITTEDVRKTIAGKGAAFYVLGRIDYEDTANRYWTIICWYYDRDLSRLTVCSGHNDEGLEKKRPVPMARQVD